MKRPIKAYLLCLLISALAGSARAGNVEPARIQLWLSVTGTHLKLSHRSEISASGKVVLPINIAINLGKHYQTIVGFGAAVTDASAELIQHDMTPIQRSALLRDLFGRSPGIGLSMLRLTIGASDFSPQRYSLDMVPKGRVDPDLTHFSVNRTLHTVIPTIKEAIAINPRLRLIASPWSPPAWMKTSDSLIGGTLLPQYQKTFVDYLLKYLEAYQRHKISIYALTLQNEPGFSPSTYPGMKMSASLRAHIISQYLGPALAKRKHKTLILDWDHNWNHPEQPLQVLADPNASRYIAGVAWHCYEGNAKAQSLVHKAFPRKAAFLTECSDGEWDPVNSSGLVWLTRNILLDATRNWARGVLFWNLALDAHHGPHLKGCDKCIGVVTIDRKTGDVTYNRDYYALAHFSRFVRRDAVRVASSGTVSGVSNVAFQNKDHGSVVLVVVNEKPKPRKISVNQSSISFQYTMPPRSVATFVWSPRYSRVRPGG
ncbi:MAG: glycosyl hydrolase [Rhodanobacter sp.]|nr:MAG: glycosyl hydrolase [Rhodanobacter sp.]